MGSNIMKKYVALMIAFLLMSNLMPSKAIQAKSISAVEIITVNADGKEVEGIQTVNKNGDETVVSFTIFYEESGGEISFVNPMQGMVQTIGSIAKPMAGKTYKSVTASAIYDTKSDGYGGYYYRPRRVEGVSSGTNGFTIIYTTGGGRLNSNLVATGTGGVHKISLVKSSPSINQVYSTTLLSQYYYNVTSGYVDPHHMLYITVGGSTLAWNLPPYHN